MRLRLELRNDYYYPWSVISQKETKLGALDRDDGVMMK
jgi:hypothetical protein